MPPATGPPTRSCSPLPMKARLLALLLPLFALTASVKAASVSDLIYIDASTEIVISGCKSSAFGDLDIPATINGRPVKAILPEAFRYRSQLTSVTIPSSVTSIGQEAFYSCSGLTSVTLPPNLTHIRYNTFADCSSLTAITLPASLEVLGQDAFARCTNLASITWPAGLTSIGSYAFDRCTSLTSITVPPSVTSIAQRAFYGCTSLTSVTLPPGLTTISDGLFYDCTSLPAVEIPAGVTVIEGSAFQNCKAITSLTIPAGVTKIDYYTFTDCTALTTVSLPAGITLIDELAFARCTSLANITLPAALTWIGKDAFLNCSSIPAISLASTLTHIGDRAFSGCTGISAVAIPASVTTIGKAAFTRCTALEAITVDPANANYMSPAGILISKDGTLLLQCGGAALTAVIPPGVTTIAESAFAGCGKITTITIPASVEQIRDSAFASCTKLKTFLFLGNLPGIGSDVFLQSATTTAYHLAGKFGWQYFEELPSAVVGLPVLAVGPSDVAAAPGGTASLHVEVDPSYPLPCQYQWQKNGIDLPGATQPSLAFTNLQPSDAAAYTVRVSSPVGTISDHATLSLSAGNLYTQSQYDAGVTLGYQLGRQAGIDEIMEEPNAFDLFSSAQIQTLHLGTPLLQRDAASGEFELKLSARKSSTLGSFTPLSFAAGDITLSPGGELIFRFSSPDSAAFFRIDTE